VLHVSTTQCQYLAETASGKIAGKQWTVFYMALSFSAASRLIAVFLKVGQLAVRLVELHLVTIRT